METEPLYLSVEELQLEWLQHPEFRKLRGEKWQEIKCEFSIGMVVGMLLEEKDPRWTIVYYDGGRRRVTKDDKVGIVYPLNNPGQEISEQVN